MSTLDNLVRIRGWLTDSLIAYLAWVDQQEIELPRYYPRRLTMQAGVMQRIWQRLQVRSRPDQSQAPEGPYAFRRQSPNEEGERSVVTWDKDTAERYRRAVVLGDPGAGKTWLLRRIARQSASEALRDLVDHRAVTAHGVSWPVRVRLPELARSPGEAIEALLAVSVCDKAALGKPNGGVAPQLRAFVEAAVRDGRALVLLDAWDEVPRRWRADLDVRLRAFAERCPRARIVLTSRDVGGVDASLLDSSAAGRDRAADLELLAFGSDQVPAFVAGWFDGATAGSPLARASRALLRVLRDHPPMAALARNPLMLTFMCRLAEDGAGSVDAIPTRRVHLFAGVLKGLLQDWWAEDRKPPPSGLKRPPIESDAELAAHLELLAPVALALVEAGQLGEVDESELRAVITRCHDALMDRRPRHELRTASATSLLDRWKSAGLLVPTGGGELLFLHRTFQEYLAGIALVPEALVALSTPADERAAAEAECAKNLSARLIGAKRRQADWQEPIRLALGYIGVIRQRPRECAAVVRAVIERAPGPLGGAAAAMGVAVAEIASGGRSAAQHGVPDSFRSALVGTVQVVMRDEPMRSPSRLGVRSDVLAWRPSRRRAAVTAAVRAAGGNALARLGDPRFHGSERWGLPNDVICGFVDDADKDLLGFLKVEPPASGTFEMGSDDADQEAYYNEKPRQRVRLTTPFYMARWPVTVAQFRLFVRAGRYRDAGPAWEQGLANHPVVHVSFWDALAYCDWLTTEVRVPGHRSRLPAALQGVLAMQPDADWRISLPTEPQWEWAARGPERHVYPGGPPLTPERANYDETGLGTTSAAGCFPQGASWCGVEELAGNAWEWTRSKYCGYTSGRVDADDPSRDGFEGDDPRVLRGGAFSLDRLSVRAAFRNYYEPVNRYDFNGFRVVLCPFRSEP